MRRVVITGLGAVTPVGNDAAATWRALVSGQSGIGTITHFDASALPIRIAGEVKSFALDPAIDPREARRMLTSAIKVVAGELGNTPAVCRASYVHPVVPASYLDGTLPARWAAGPARPTQWLRVGERRLLHLLEHADEPAATGSPDDVGSEVAARSA